MHCEVGEGAALLDTRSSRYFSLNGVGAFLWAQLTTPKSPPELVSAVLSQFEVSEDACRADVLRLLKQLLDAGLISEDNSAAAPE